MTCPSSRAFDILGARLDGGHHHGVGIAHRRVDDLALAFEHEADRAGLAQIAAMFAEGRAHGRRGAVAVVGHRLDDHRHAVGAVALVADLLVVVALAALAFLIARSITSLGTDCALASLTASRRRGFLSGSGSPILAATVISLASFENSLDRAASWRPLRCWMFAHFEWPAMVLGLVPAETAFSGFGHPAVVVVALVLVISAGLVRSGAVLLITRTLVDASRALGAHIAIMGGVAGILSAFMNNVAALALLMPVDIATARKAGRSPSLSLMPLSFATILGGMVTLIGTPPNIIIATFRQDALGAPFAMFDFAPVGAVAAASGLVFVALIGWRLIPNRDSGVGGDPLAELEPYIAELRLPEGSKLVGKRLRELEADAAKADVALIGIVRDGRRRFGTGRNLRLAAGDMLVIEADPAALDEFRAAEGLETPSSSSGAGAVGDGVTLVEAVVPDGARIAGKTVESVGLAWRQNTTLMGVARQGQRITKSLRKTVIEPGDILLLLTPADRAEDVVSWLGGMTLADRGLSVTQETKTWAAIAVFAGAVMLAALGALALPVALGIVAVAFVAMRIVPLSELYDRIEWPVVVLLGSMIPLGRGAGGLGGHRASGRRAHW
jgi:di/tricarboxylate transporter